MFAGIETQQACLHSLVDLELHGERRPHTAEQSAQLVRRVASEHTLLPLAQDVPSPRWHAGFRHLASYGTGYYTYTWARSISSRIWQSHFADDPLRADAGERWCSTVLRHGGARDPRDLLRDLLHDKHSPVASSDEVDRALLDLVEI